MSSDVTTNAAENENLNEEPGSQVHGTVTESKEPLDGMPKEVNNQDSEAPKRTTDKSELHTSAHVSAHERHREEHASHRVREAQKYNNREKLGRGGFGKGRGGYKNKSRFDPSKQEKSDDPAAIRKQVEFYFSDSNLLTDKFLFERVEGHKNNPVPIDVIHSFKRMQHFQPREAIVEALKGSLDLEVVEDNTAVRRKEPLPENLTGKSMDEVQKVHENRSMAKSIYAKGFGEEESTTQFDVEAWFANYGLTNSVRLRRDANKGFKGSVFVEFDTEEAQQNFLSLNPPPKWRGKDLEIKSKKQYCDAKVDDINEGRIRKNSPDAAYEGRREKRPRRGSPTYDNKRHDNAEGDHDRDWRQRRSEDAARGHRDSKYKSRGGSGRRDRVHNRGVKSDNNRSDEQEDKQPEEDDATRVKATAPKKLTNDATHIEDLSNENENSKKVAGSFEGGVLTGDSNGRKRAHEDEDDEKQGNAKKMDLKKDSD